MRRENREGLIELGAEGNVGDVGGEAAYWTVEGGSEGEVSEMGERFLKWEQLTMHVGEVGERGGEIDSGRVIEG